MTHNDNEETSNTQTTSDTDSSSSEPVMGLETIIKSGDTSSGSTFVQKSDKS